MKCLGGRELRGALRGYDELVNLVLDDCEEFIRGKYEIIDILVLLLIISCTNFLTWLMFQLLFGDHYYL